jgi:hypothetical protein
MRETFSQRDALLSLQSFEHDPDLLSDPMEGEISPILDFLPGMDVMSNRE